jgi:hypothetical protein
MADETTTPRSKPLPTAIAFAVWVLIAATASVPAWRMMGLL